MKGYVARFSAREFSSKDQEKGGFSIPAQLKLLRAYALAEGILVVDEHVDVETAKQAGRSSFGEMVDYLHQHPEARIILRWSHLFGQFGGKVKGTSKNNAVSVALCM